MDLEEDERSLDHISLFLKLTEDWILELMQKALHIISIENIRAR